MKKLTRKELDLLSKLTGIYKGTIVLNKIMEVDKNKSEKEFIKDMKTLEKIRSKLYL